MVNKSVDSDTLYCMVHSEHNIKTDKAFTVLYQVQNDFVKDLRLTPFPNDEAIIISWKKPDSCVKPILFKRPRNKVLPY